MAEPTPGPVVDPLLGSLLDGRYRLQEVIGQGASGRVYRAEQEPMGREVAVKLMHPPRDLESAHDLQARFLREAALAGRIQHPHVVTVHDYGRTEQGDCFIVMELLRGRTLRDRLRQGPLPLAAALRITEQLLRGLRAAHRAGLVHRDVKPSNVMLLRADDDGDFVKLFDFGLVKGDDEATITQVGMFVGTPQYVAPEQARAEDSDPRSDLYSVGIILYRMVTGVLPFSAENPLAVAWMHVREELPAMAAKAPGVVVPAPVEALTRRLLEKDPVARPVDADAALTLLVELRAELGLPAGGERGGAPLEDTLRTPLHRGAGPHPPAETAPSPPPVRSARVDAVEALQEEVAKGPARAGRRWMAAGVLAVAVGLAVGGLGLYRSRVDRERPGGADGAPPASPSPVVEAEVPADEPPAPPLPPPPREVAILISSEPAGAEVYLGELLLGTTPLARSLAVLEGEGGPQVFRLALPGHAGAQVTLDLDQDTAAGHARLAATRSSLAEGTAAAEGAGRAGGTAVVADDVRFTPAQAAAALAWINEADAETLRASGVAARQVNIILDGRPFADLAAFAQTPYIGTKTLERIQEASAR